MKAVTYSLEEIATVTLALRDLSATNKRITELEEELKAAKYSAQCWEQIAKNAQALNAELRKLLPTGDSDG